MKKRGRWSALATFGPPLVLLVVIAAYGAVQNRRSTDARAHVGHLSQMQAVALQMEVAVASMELHQRGFLLAGTDRELAARDRARAQGRALASRLLASTAGDPVQGDLARRVHEAFDLRYRYMRSVEAIVRRDGLDAGRRRFQPEGVGSVTPVLEPLRSIRGVQAELLARSSAAADRQARDFQRVLVYGTAVALALLVLAAVLLHRQLRRTQELGDALATAHEEQLIRAQDLQRANRELEAFSYTISHDLRAPLRHIGGYAQMLQEDAGDLLTGDMRRYVDTITESSRRMGALIDDLLAFSRLGRKPVERVDVDMGELVERVVVESGARGSQASILIGPLPTLMADPVLMRQVWLNLVSNAVKYSRTRGDEARIEIEGERDAETVRYRVRDNGVGFDMRYADKLFGVFQRLHSDDEFEGTGVGLAIAHQIVTRHGGRIHADARPGEGACFTIEFPVEGE